ncbi:MAG: glycosyl transferase [Proteobacteria bacterium]|nr:glycosyl transferase [Pseudomonadota bacterium]
MAQQSIVELFRNAEKLETAGDSPGAVSLYKTWIALNPADPHLHAAMFNYAVVMARGGDKVGAVNVLRDCIRLKPDFQPPHINLGRLLEDLGQSGTAVSQWLDFVKTLPEINGDGIKHKIMALQQVGRVLEGNHVDGPAEDALRQSIDIRPNQPEVIQHWIALRQKQCKWPVIQGWEGVSKEALLAHISPLSAAVMYDDPVLQLGRAWRYARSLIKRPQTIHADHAARRAARPNRLKIGYVSSDLREHAVGFGLSEALGLHDTDRYDIHAYYCGIAKEDATKERIRGSVEHWTDISGMSDDDAAAAIQADGIDILIDVNGYTRDARTAVFARRPAPIQVNWYGFPGTMGTPYHHYVIADDIVVPREDEIFFTERVLRIPCYQPNDRKRIVAEETPSRASENLPEEGFVFCCLNGSQKITAAIFDAWMEILRGVQGSVLWLLDSTADTHVRLRQMAEERGVAGERLCFAPKRPNPQHLARYRLADLFLDTYPYGAHTTASDAMWMGAPVLTVPGRSFASRVCASLVTAGGAPELVCATLQDYIARAIALGNDRDAALALREKIEQVRNSSVLFDTDLLVRSLEGLYEQMWEDFAQDRLPQPDLRNLAVYEEVALALNAEASDVSMKDYAIALSAYNAHYPLLPDNRLWRKGSQADLHRLQAAVGSTGASSPDPTEAPEWLQRVA